MRKIMSIFIFCIIFVQYAFGETGFTFNTESMWLDCEMNHCAVFVTNRADSTSGIKILKLENDEFDLGTLDESWNWEVGTYNGQPRGAYSFPVTPSGFLQLKVTAPSGTPQPYTEWISNINTAPKIYRNINFKDNYSIETYTSIPSILKIDHEGHGMFIRQNPNDAILLGAASLSQYSNPIVFACRISNGSHEDFFGTIDTRYNESNYPEPVTDEGIYLKMQKSGNQISTYYKMNEYDSWVLVKGFNGIGFQQEEIGLYMKHTTRNNEYANFDYFRFIGDTEFNSAEIISPFVDLGFEPVGQGVLTWSQNLPDPSCGVDIYVTTSEDKGGAVWEGPYNETMNSGVLLTSRNRRYVRFKAVLKTSDLDYTPEIYNIKVTYPLDGGENDSAEIFNNGRTKVYPTITSNSIKIEYELIRVAKFVKMKIFSSVGKAIESFEGSSNVKDYSILKDVSSLSNGVYFLKIYAETDDGKKQEKVMKFVVHK